MVPCVFDSSLYVKYINRTLVGMTCNYVDDGLNSGTPEFEQLTERTMQDFLCKERNYGDFSVFGTHIHTVGENEFFLNRNITVQHYEKYHSQPPWRTYHYFVHC